MKSILTILVLVLTCSSMNAQISFFEGSFEDAKAEASKEGKMLFIDFYADWCVPCKQMERYGFRDADFSRVINTHFVAFKVDVDMFTGMDIAEKYRVNKYPTLLVLDARGTEKRRTEGYQSADELNELVKNYTRN